MKNLLLTIFMAFSTAVAYGQPDWTPSSSDLVTNGSTNNVGIGTSSPDKALTVKSSIGLMSSAGSTRMTITGDESENTISTSGGVPLGINISGTNFFAVRTNTLQRFTVLGSGAVGIGTSSPFLPLSVMGGSSAASTNTMAAGILQLMTGSANTDHTLQFGIVDGSYSWLQSVVPNTGYRPIVLQPNGGNVGIGVTSPSYKLQAGTVGTSVFKGVGNSSTADDPLFYLQDDSSSNGDLEVYADVTNINVGPYANKGLNFVRNAGTSSMTITNAGKVGIGTQSPQKTFHLVGGARMAYDASNGGYIEGANTGNSILGVLSLGASYDMADVGEVALFTYTNKPLHLGTNDIERLTITGGGNTGIGIDSPSEKLHLVGNFRYVDGNQADGNILVSNATGVATWTDPSDILTGVPDLQAVTTQGNTTNVATTFNADVTINGCCPGALTVRGGIVVDTGGYTDTKETGGSAGTAYFNTSGKLTRNSSDARLKTNVETMQGNLDKILSLRPVSFNYLDIKNYGTGKYLGFIAQEAEKIVPEAVSMSADSYKLRSMNYSAIIPVLTGAMQEQQKMIGELGHENVELHKVIAGLESRLAELELKVQSNNTSVSTIASNEPRIATLGQNIPNPANGSTTIGFSIKGSYTSAFMGIYDMNGRQLKQMIIKPGQGQIDIEKGQLLPGIYTYCLVVNNELVDTKKMIITE